MRKISGKDVETACMEIFNANTSTVDNARTRETRRSLSVSKIDLWGQHHSWIHFHGKEGCFLSRTPDLG